MVKSCAAFNCTSRWKRKSNISFHFFPVENGRLLKKWVTATNRKNFKPNKYSVLCSRHFTEDDYHMKLPNTVRRRLKNNAIPTIFHFPPNIQNALPKWEERIVKKISVGELATSNISVVDDPFIKEESNSLLRKNVKVKLKEFNLLNVQGEVPFPSCDNTDFLSVVTVKEEIHSEASSEVDECTPHDDILGNINETFSSDGREEGRICLNNGITPFCFVGIKMENPDDYESDLSFVITKHSTEEFPTNSEAEYDIGVEGLKEKLRIKLNNNSCVGIEMEKMEENVECIVGF